MNYLHRSFQWLLIFHYVFWAIKSAWLQFSSSTGVHTYSKRIPYSKIKFNNYFFLSFDEYCFRHFDKVELCKKYLWTRKQRQTWYFMNKNATLFVNSISDDLNTVLPLRSLSVMEVTKHGIVFRVFPVRRWISQWYAHWILTFILRRWGKTNR